MKSHIGVLVLVTMLGLLCTTANAEVMTLEFGGKAAEALRYLGKCFVSGCVVLVGGAVITVWTIKDKGK